MVCRDVRGDGDDLTRLILPHNDAIGELAAGSLVLLHCRVPGVTTYATFAANGRTPLVTLPTTETLHPLIVFGVVGKAVVVHRGSGRRLDHAAVTRDLETEAEDDDGDSNKHVDDVGDASPPTVTNILNFVTFNGKRKWILFLTKG